MSGLLLSAFAAPAAGGSECHSSQDVSPEADHVLVCTDGNNNLTPDHVRVQTDHGHAEYEEWKWCLGDFYCSRGTDVEAAAHAAGAYAGGSVDCTSHLLYWSFFCHSLGGGGSVAGEAAAAEVDIDEDGAVSACRDASPAGLEPITGCDTANLLP